MTASAIASEKTIESMQSTDQQRRKYLYLRPQWKPKIPIFSSRNLSLRCTRQTHPNRKRGRHLHFSQRIECQIISAPSNNINALRKKIIYLFGETAAKIYGLIPKSCAETIGM